MPVRGWTQDTLVSLEIPLVKKGLTYGHLAIATHHLSPLWGTEDLFLRFLRYPQTGDAAAPMKTEIFPPP